MKSPTLLSATWALLAALVCVPAAMSGPPTPTFTFSRTWVGQTATSCSWDLTADWTHADVRVVVFSWLQEPFPGDGFVSFTRGNVDLDIPPVGRIHDHSVTYRVTVPYGQVWNIAAILTSRDGDRVAGTIPDTAECTLTYPA